MLRRKAVNCGTLSCGVTPCTCGRRPSRYRQLMEDFLGAAGIPTVAASDGLEALKRLAESTSCLILLDLWMPKMDGWRFREEQRRLNDSALAEVPVVILTAGLDCEEEARAVGAVAFLKKRQP